LRVVGEWMFIEGENLRRKFQREKFQIPQNLYKGNLKMEKLPIPKKPQK